MSETPYIPPEPAVIHRPGSPENPLTFTEKGKALVAALRQQARQCPACNELLPHSRLAREGCWLMREESLSTVLRDVTDKLGVALCNADAYRDEAERLRAERDLLRETLDVTRAGLDDRRRRDSERYEEELRAVDLRPRRPDGSLLPEPAYK